MTGQGGRRGEMMRYGECYSWGGTAGEGRGEEGSRGGKGGVGEEERGVEGRKEDEGIGDSYS